MNNVHHHGDGDRDDDKGMMMKKNKFTQCFPMLDDHHNWYDQEGHHDLNQKYFIGYQRYLCGSIGKENNVIILMFRNTSLLTRLASPVDILYKYKYIHQIQYREWYINQYNTQ